MTDTTTEAKKKIGRPPGTGKNQIEAAKAAKFDRPGSGFSSVKLDKGDPESKPKKAPKPPKEPKAKKVKEPPPPPPEGSIGYKLNEIEDPAPGEGLESYFARMQGTANKAQVGTNLVRLKLGLYLLKLQPRKQKGKNNVKEWQKAEAAKLGIKDRQIRTLIGVAKAIKRQLAVKLPVEALLDRPLEKVAKAVRETVAGRDPDADKAPKETKTAPEAVKSSTAGILAKFNKANEADRASIIKTVSALLDTLKA